MEEYPLVVIVGPTAAGKSHVAVEAASLINGEIVSGDSVQIYRGMDIGTGKVSADEMVASNGRRIVHHLLDIADPDESFSVADYQARAKPIVSEIAARDHVPVLVGGTGLYIQAVVDPYRFCVYSSDPGVRKELTAEAAEKGMDRLYRQLVEIDPTAAAKIHPGNVRRVIRALEVYRLTGKPISTTWMEHRHRAEEGFRPVMAGLTLQREELYRRIDQRVDKMMADGLVEEVSGLLGKGYSPHLKSMQTLGYRHITEYLLGQTTLDAAVQKLKQDTRKFAKRQYTWFRRDPRIQWYDVGKDQSVTKIAFEIASSVAGQYQQA